MSVVFILFYMHMHMHMHMCMHMQHALPAPVIASKDEAALRRLRVERESS